jgi:hypothetical protein
MRHRPAVAGALAVCCAHFDDMPPAIAGIVAHLYLLLRARLQP